MEKEGLIRKEKLSLRKALEPQKRKELNRLIYEKIINLPQYEKAQNIFLYASTEYEADTFAIMEHALSLGKSIALPLTVSDTEMQFYNIDDLENQLKPGFMGILEPDLKVLSGGLKKECDLIIVPGSVFDLQMNRMGYGKGYYDRYLKNRSCLKIGICYEIQLTGCINAKATDVKMDMLVTEKAVYCAQ